MCFYGSKFLFFMIAAMIFMGIFGFLFLLYQVNAATDASATQVYVMLFVCLAISGLASYCLHKFIKASTVPILGGFAGVAVCQTIVKTFQIKQPVVGLVALIIGGAGGAYLGHMLGRHVKTVGTAIIGSAAVIQGIRNLVGDDSDIDQSALTVEQIGYLFGTVALAAAGSYFQLGYVETKPLDDDDVFAQGK